MKTFGMTLMLKDDPEVITRYKRYHREPWPEVVSHLRKVGITEMRIYLVVRRLFMYMETVDGFEPGRDFPKLDELPRYREWNELMTSMQERAPEASPTDWWAPMEQVFDLSQS